MKKIIIAGCVGAGCVFSGQAELVHRYMLDGNVQDSIGSAHGKITAGRNFLEAPVFGAEVPADIVQAGPQSSMEVGMNVAADKKSGFELRASVVNDIAEEGTIAFFVKPKSWAAAKWIFFAPMLDSGIGLFGTGAGMISAFAGGNSKMLPPVPFAVGQWNHLMLTWKRTGLGLTACLYVNGTLCASETTDKQINVKSICVGGYGMADIGGQSKQQFSGFIYDVQFYNKALTVENAAALSGAPGSIVLSSDMPVVGLASRGRIF
jgi:hypothetical protein